MPPEKQGAFYLRLKLNGYNNFRKKQYRELAVLQLFRLDG